METWNRHDAPAIAKDCLADFDDVNRLGAWRKGKEEMEQEYIRGHAPGGMFTHSSNRKFVIERVKFMRPDVVVVIVQRSNDRNRDRSTFVLTKEGTR